MFRKRRGKRERSKSRRQAIVLNERSCTMTYRTRRDEGSAVQQWIGQQRYEDPRGHNCCSVSSGVGRRNTLTRAPRGCDAAYCTGVEIVGDWGALVARPPSHWLALTRLLERGPPLLDGWLHFIYLLYDSRAIISANKNLLRYYNYV